MTTNFFRKVEPVERVRRLAPDEFNRRFASAHRPVIIEGVASEWPARSQWSLDHFAARLPDLRVPIEIWDGDEAEADAASYLKQLRGTEMTFAEYARVCRAGNSKRHYLAQYPIFKHAPALRADVGELEPYFDFPFFFPRPLRSALTAQPLLWVGPGGTVSTLHFDMYQNLFVQLAGRKRFLLVAPEQSARLYYPDRRFGMLANFSPLDVEKPDLERHPLAREVEALECVVEPGEMLFIPIGWWHHVRSFEPSISMNFWWWPIARTLYYGRRHILHAARSVLTGNTKLKL
jgi:hypothetical protein